MSEEMVDVVALTKYMKRLENKTDAMEKERLQESASILSPKSNKGSENGSVFKEAVKNYDSFEGKMTIHDLGGDNGIERGAAWHMPARYDQGAASIFDNQERPAGNQVRMGGNMKIPKLMIRNPTGEEIYPGLGAGLGSGPSFILKQLNLFNCLLDLREDLDGVAVNYFQTNITTWWQIPQ